MPTDERPIVVPLDGSKNSEHAVPHAARLAAMYGASLRFIHVADDDEVKDGSITNASNVFASYVDDLMANVPGGLEHSAELLLGKPAEMILERAEDARFLVLASHGRGGFHATFVGSVADKVVRGAAVPVVFVPSIGEPTAPTYQQILVALDGSREAEAGLALAREIAEHTKGKLSLLQAYSIPPPVGVEFGYYPPDVMDSLEDASESYLSRTARENEERIVMQASPPLAIEQSANRIDADLVVLTSHGKGLATRIALGSTTDRVMHSLHRTLLIVPIVD